MLQTERMKFMKKFLSILLVLFLCLGAFAGCKKQERGGVIAKVGNREIAFDDFLDTLDYYVYYLSIDASSASSKESVMQLAQQILDSMVLSEVVYAKGEELGYYDFSEEERAKIEENVASEMSSWPPEH